MTIMIPVLTLFLITAGTLARQQPAKPAMPETAKGAPDACALMTQSEATQIMGGPSRVPRVGAFAANTCIIQSDTSPTTIFINLTLDTDATLQVQGTPTARQAFDGLQKMMDDAEVLKDTGDAAFFSRKNNGVYIFKGGQMASLLVGPELMKREAAVAGLKKLATVVATRM